MCRLSPVAVSGRLPFVVVHKLLVVVASLTGSVGSRSSGFISGGTWLSSCGTLEVVLGSVVAAH